MPLRYDENASNILEVAKRISRNLEHFYLGAEHIALASLEVDGNLRGTIASCGVDVEGLPEIVKATATPSDRAFSHQPETPRCRRVIKQAENVALSLKAYKIEPVHFLISVLKEGKGVFWIALEQLEISPSELLSNLENACRGGSFRGENMGNVSSSSYSSSSSSSSKSSSNLNNQKPVSGKGSKTPLLDKYARNIIEVVKTGKVDPVIGRDEEILRILQVISRKGKNNPVLTGEAGVGKTAVVFGLAQRIASGKVPDSIKDKIIMDLPMTNLVAGAKHRGEFEERLQAIMKEVSSNPNIIVFIDELHTIVGAGDSSGGMDASNILKPMLARGEFPIIGATTTDEYRKYIEKDPALERRFQPVYICEPSEDDTYKILQGIKSKYEKHHGVYFDDKALLSAIKLSVRYLPDRNLPDKAIDLIDEAAAKVKMAVAASGDSSAKVEVKEEAIAEVVSLWTGIPVSKMTGEEKERLLKLEDHLKNRVIGQDEAVTTVAKTIRMVRMGLSNPNRPGGIFLFLGPTGVGKTELAKALADFLFGSEKEMIRLDMSEFMEKHAIARLIGSPPGYVGHEEDGQLTSSVRAKPYSVVLLDEVEKAHPEVFDLFLQVFDDGRLTDSKGRTVNFTNTIIILTSNIGSSKVDENGNSVLVDSRNEEVREQVMRELRKHFRPEFINRIDEIILFNPLEKEALKGIVDITVADIVKRVKDKGITLTFDESAIELFLDKGYNRAYGARPLKRAVQNYLTKPLAEQMLQIEIGENYKYNIKAFANSTGDGLDFVIEGNNGGVPPSLNNSRDNIEPTGRFDNQRRDFPNFDGESTSAFSGTYIGE
ncbi:ATP-dependent Clp protease ATP-binding subunit [bacterium]|nr:ATP-dependent Clp protease ATP-binding subunit [bacterium]